MYSISSQVIPHEVRRQGLNQENPCPGDKVEFTCTRSETTPVGIRWIANEIPLYAFGIPVDIGGPNANQSQGFPGISAILVNNTTVKLFVDLNCSSIVGNGTTLRVTCESIPGSQSSANQTLTIIGKILILVQQCLSCMYSTIIVY